MQRENYRSARAAFLRKTGRPMCNVMEGSFVQWLSLASIRSKLSDIKIDFNIFTSIYLSIYIRWHHIWWLWLFETCMQPIAIHKRHSLNESIGARLSGVHIRPSFAAELRYARANKRPQHAFAKFSSLVRNAIWRTAFWSSASFVHCRSCAKERQRISMRTSAWEMWRMRKHMMFVFVCVFVRIALMLISVSVQLR